MTGPSRTAWSAPHRDGPLHASVTLPGSKSATNRALLLSALATGSSMLRRPLAARDTSLMIDALRSLGCEFVSDEDSVTVHPRPLRGPADVDCGLAGTVMRFVPPVAALAEGEIGFDGDERARERPMREILDALRRLGADIDASATALPFRLRGTGRMAGGVVEIDACASSQFISALLLAGARYDAGVDVRHTGKPLPSLPHVAMTVAMLRERGVLVDDAEPNRWVVSPGAIAPLDVEIEPDLSGAAPFAAAAVVRGGTVLLRDWPAVTTQPGDQLRWILESFGAQATLGAEGLLVKGSGVVPGVDLDLHEVGELAPVIAAVAALADEPSYLRGIAHLRGHETDRLAALAGELGALGARVEETDDGLRFWPASLHGGLFRTYADHRLAHAAAVVGLVVRDVQVDDIATTGKTFPGFASAWAAMAR